jgi:hypothetical protein
MSHDEYGAIRSELEHAYNEHKKKGLSLDDLVVFVTSECFAVPLNIAAGEAFVAGHGDRAALGWGIGVPLAVLGFTFHWWKGWIPTPIRSSILWAAKYGWPVALLAAFAYVAAPDIYRRATAPPQAEELGVLQSTVGKPLAPEGVISGLQAANELKELRSQVEKLKRERDAALVDVKRLGAQPLPTQIPVASGPVTWNLDGQLLVVSFNGRSYEVNALIFQGTSNVPLHFKEAYLISGITGHRVDLLIAARKFGAELPVNAVDVPTGAPVQLDCTFKPNLSVRDFFDQWGKFRLIVIYDDGSSFEHDYSENEVRQQAQRQMPDAFGPQVTPKEQK